MDTTPVWLERARAWIGVTAIAGAQSNPAVLGLYAACGHPEIRDDDVAWCAAWLGGGPLAECGIKGTGSLLAASYAEFGEAVDGPRPGAIAVWPNHVAIVSEVFPDGRFKAIGGNQGHSQGISAVTEAVFRRSDAVRFRWPVPLVTPRDLDAAGSRTTSKGLTDIVIGKGLAAVGVAVGAQGGAPAPAPEAPNIEQSLSLLEHGMRAADAFGKLLSGNLPAVIIFSIGVYLVASGALLRRWRAEDANAGKNTARTAGG